MTDEIARIAARCAHELHGYAVTVSAGTEAEVIADRLDELEACCANYSRALRHMHATTTSTTKEVEK